ncbi:RNA polymerase sigma factor [Chitinophaga sp. 22321]|uniref:RNA polymerase sigma-70 factor n=1 Tax=Chitinophaga hostae TaxID=2831022 RepID=A0ABS5J7A7_9BACT|nr:RNA polymerase sigma-70 factor [Chitinophaga hostae]MBS0031103.1 RNA polymerase sigma-70 factor [Chitinophaga hostae]
MNNTEDRLLFSKIAVGDETAFRLLYHRYNAVLSGSVKKLLKTDAAAEEVLQEVFLKIWLVRHTLADIENPGGWMYTLAANYSLSALRKHAREKHRQDDISEDVPDNEDLSSGIYARELQELIKHAVEKLPASRREVFMMNTRDGKSRKEIATALDISENTVKNQLVTARKFIREYLEKQTGTRLPILLIILLSRFF